MYGYVNGDTANTFEIRTTDTEHFLNKNDFVVIMRKDSSITLGCSVSDPCRLTVKGEE